MISAELCDIMRNARRVVALTGAGISKESGIPTFREAQTGLWAQYDPEELATPAAFLQNPQLVWGWYQWRRGLIQEAKPNPGHFALAEIERRVPVFHLVTQNVDGLHHAAGSQNVLELHGNIMRTKCFQCNQAAQDSEEGDETPPRCSACGGALRPDVVWFGEGLPQAAWREAVEAASAAEVLMAVGTSAIVHPAASLPVYAREAGAVLVEINPVDTPLSGRAQYCLRGMSGEVLPQLVRQVWGG